LDKQFAIPVATWEELVNKDFLTCLASGTQFQMQHQMS